MYDKNKQLCMISNFIQSKNAYANYFKMSYIYYINRKLPTELVYIHILDSRIPAAS